MLTRDTEWRQGGLLTLESSWALGLFERDIVDQCVVVISHDCDLPNEKEEVVELIVGVKITSIDSSLAKARNIRCIHLCYKTFNPNQDLFVELQRS